MRLLKITPIGADDDVNSDDDFDFELVTMNKPVSYAILSHTWDSDPDKEYLFEDIQNGTGWQKKGYRKVKQFLAAVRKHDPAIEYGWVDTCCIDKSSSAELSEAINSMFRFYMEAEFCYVHLADFNDKLCTAQHPELSAELGSCRWFQRGWTLQELLAPRKLAFYSRNWSHVGDREGLGDIISEITQIHAEALGGDFKKLSRFSIAQRMSWASFRETTRLEDMAYCLLGIFDVNMPLLYGEGHKAFARLQEEIIKDSDDQTIFCWARGEETDLSQHLLESSSSFLAMSPRDFQNSGKYIPIRGNKVRPFQLTNAGLRITAPLQHREGTYRLVLRCRHADRHWAHQILKLVIVRISPDSNQFLRVPSELRWDFDDNLNFPEQEIYLCKSRPQFNQPRCMGHRVSIDVDQHLLKLGSVAKVGIKDVYPPSRWDSKQGVLSAADLDPESDSLTGFSWHVVIRISVAKAKVEATVLLFAGYNSWLDVAWCELKEMQGALHKLSESWRSHGHRARSNEQSSRLALAPFPDLEIRCIMVNLKPEDEGRWRMMLNVRKREIPL